MMQISDAGRTHMMQGDGSGEMEGDGDGDGERLDKVPPSEGKKKQITGMQLRFEERLGW